MIDAWGSCWPEFKASFCRVVCDQCGKFKTPHVPKWKPQLKDWPAIWEECRQQLASGKMWNWCAGHKDYLFDPWECTDEHDLCPECVAKREWTE